MAIKSTAMKWVFMGVICTYSVLALANKTSNPQFSGFQINVSTGSFAANMHFEREQQLYSQTWKQSIQHELNKPVNFAGHYRIYTTVGGHGNECQNEAWVCGWIIDKFTGEIVSRLPKDTNGSSVYANVGNNGTPVGYPFKIDAYKDSTMVVITGQSIPFYRGMNDNPMCKSAVYNFKNNKFEKLVESSDGCKIDE